MHNVGHSIALIAVMALVTAALRFLPFLIFPAGKKTPRILDYLGAVLPGATMGMLVVYCFKTTTVLSYPFAAPELIASAVVVITYLVFKKTLLSVGLGTVLYMILVQVVF